jgi:YVTN family beta-propeller protein
MVLFDPTNGYLYVRGSDGGAISVVDASTDSVLTQISVGLGGSAYIPNVATMALDLATGDLYETNPSLGTVGYIQTSTSTLAGSVAVGGSPGGIVYDPANGNLYTSNWFNGTVTGISGATHQVVATLGVGGEPGAILFDPIDTEVFVSNFRTGNVSVLNTTREAVVANPTTGTTGGEPVALTLNTKDDLVNVVNSLTGNITVINGTTNLVTASIPVGSVPTSASYSAPTDTLLVANGGSNNVTVLQQPGNTAIASIAIGHGAQGAAEDPVNGYVYIADYGADSISVIDPSSDSVVGTVTTGNFPEDLAVDTASGNVFVANLGTYDSDSNLTVLSSSTSAAVGSIPLNSYPTSLTAAPNGDVYAIDYGGESAFIVDSATNSATGLAPASSREPTSSAWDSATGDLYIASEGTGTINVVTGAGGPVATLQLGFGTEGVVYDPSTGNVDVSNFYSGNITVIDGATESVRSVISVLPFDSLGAEIYDPLNSEVFVADYSEHNVTVLNGATTIGSIQVGSDPTSFAYDPQNGTIFVSDYGSGDISVINASTDQVAGSFSSYFPEYLAYDAGTNALYVASGENGQVLAYNATTYASLGAAIGIRASSTAGGIAYSASSGDVYVSNEYEGSLAIISAVNATSYPVTFIESGLAPETPWTVTLGGTPNSSSSEDIGFEELNGSFSYAIGDVAGYVTNVSTGVVAVAGAARTVLVGFTAMQATDTYPVMFNESGLRSGSPWEVTLTPAGATGSPTADAPSPIEYEAPNGTYTFTVSPIQGYTASPGTGAVTVAGQPEYRPIAFSAVPSPLTASLSVDPASVTLGASATFTTTVAGGSPGYSFVYTGLPAGCSTTNGAALSCTSTAAGNFTVQVNVTDQTGAYALARATLRVTSPLTAPPGNAPSSGTSTIEWSIVGVVLILVALLLILVWWRRRKRTDPTPPSNAGGTPSPPSAPPPTGSA